MVAEPLGVAGKVARVAKGRAGIASFGDRREIEDGEHDHDRQMASPGRPR
jgi:hypothetical protein